MEEVEHTVNEGPGRNISRGKKVKKICERKLESKNMPVRENRKRGVRDTVGEENFPAGGKLRDRLVKQKDRC